MADEPTTTGGRIRSFFVRDTEKDKSILPKGGGDETVVQMYQSDWKTLMAIGIFLLAIQTFIIYPFVVQQLRTGEETSDRYRLHYVSYIDDNDNGRYDDEGKDLSEPPDGDFTDPGEYPPDTLIDGPDAGEGKNVSTAITKSELKRDTGILAGNVIFVPLLYVIFLIFLMGNDDSPLTVAFWVSMGFVVPIILFTALLFLLTLVYNLAFAFAGAALVNLGSDAVGWAGDGAISGINTIVSATTGEDLIETGAASDSVGNSAAGGVESPEAASFLDAQWVMMQNASSAIFFAIFTIFVMLFAIALGVGGEESFIVKLTRGWIYGMLVALLFVFGIFTLFGIGAVIGVTG